MLGFGLHYLQVKDSLKIWKAKKMLKVEIVKKHLAQFQIYSNIGISDSTPMWYGFGSRCFFFNFSMFASWLHMLGGGGIIDNRCDFFLGIVGTLHYFELGFWHPRK
jgi:hypothetical protein